MNKLSPKEIEAVVDVLNERIAGGEDDLRDALGLTIAESKLVMNRLERALRKLQNEDLKCSVDVHDALSGLLIRHCDGSDERYWGEWDTAEEALAKADGK